MNGPTSNWGHPVAYHPRLSKFFKSLNAAIFFGQLSYWSDKTDNPLGVYKTADEWMDETGLSYREQTTARRVLSEPGFVIETNKRLEHRLFFLIDWDAFNTAFDAWSAKNPPAPNGKLAKASKRNPPNDESAFRGDTNQRSSIETETTTETTTGKKSASATPRTAKAGFSIPDGVEAQAWADYMEVRKAKRAPMTATALKALEREAGKAGVDLNTAVAACAEYSWQGFNATWYAERTALAAPAYKPAQAARPQVETFAERDERARRARWEEMTGEKWPDQPTQPQRGDFIDIQATDVRRLA